MANFYISKKQVLEIREFMENYLETSYDREKKLTHKELDCFLWENGKSSPKRVKFQNLKKEDSVNCKYLFVIDDSNKIAPYENPKYNLGLICDGLLDKDKSNLLQDLKEKRREILKSMGYTYDDFGQVIEDDCVNIKEYQEEKEDQLEKVSGETEIIYIPDVHINRTKQMIKRGTRGSVFK